MQNGLFHPAVADWFTGRFGAATPCQQRAWPAVMAGENVLVAAPTGSGKTLAAFLAALDSLVREGVDGALPEGISIVYVSPLKALSNDIQRNLEAPLAGIAEALEARGEPALQLRTAVRTGDTPATSRNFMRRVPPHILVTTPESLYVLLTSDSGREMLSGVRMVIVDEIHALAGNKRGAHLSLSLERLAALTPRPPQRIGLSATQRPLPEIARFLAGTASSCTIIDEGHLRARELAIELPPAPLEAVLAGESASDLHDRMAELIRQHHTTLVFVNTRRLAERVAKALTERLGEDAVTSHHGSMSRERRLQAEQRLKSGTLKALVATASLELGIDIGEVDLVCQLGSTRTLSMFLQRVGRSGHAVGAVAKGRLFPQTRDELVECAALLDMTRRGELDCIEIARPALDVLAQQIVAEVACRDWALGELFDCFRRAYCYRALTRESFDAVVRMLAEGYAFAQGRRGAWLHLDGVNDIVRARRGARLTALTCGGAIPDTADYDVVVEPQGHIVGTVNEDFAIESMPGNIFQLGNTAWRVLRVESSALRVADAAGQPPNIPFWFGEAPARSVEMSAAVSRVRGEFAARIDNAAGGDPRPGAEHWLATEVGVGKEAARQIYDYLLSGYRSLTAMPTRSCLVLERFFDESGGMQLVIHSPLGARINRAWGLALRKRFCRQFNFELQAAAVEDAIVISLGAVHSFPLESVWRYLAAGTVREVLTQALLDAPMFGIRWRWVAACALAIQRFRNGRKTPPRLLRMQSEDLLALVFPDQLACAENLRGRREVPDHPLVTQAIGDCLHEAMDIEGLETLLAKMAAGELELICRDLVEPSPFAQAVLNANPYAFLDDAPLEERRTLAVQSRRWIDPDTASSLGALDPSAIARVRAEVWPTPHNAEETHDALLISGVLTRAALGAGGEAAVGQWLSSLLAAGRVSEIAVPGASSPLWVATERYRDLALVWPLHERVQGRGALAGKSARDTVPGSREDALRELVRGRLAITGPLVATLLATEWGLPRADIDAALARLEQEGAILRGRYTGEADEEWCDRRLLARIHRYTMNRLRAEIEPVPTAAYMRFLLDWQYLTPASRVEGTAAVGKVIEMLAGFEAPAGAWESALLAGRVEDYSGDQLDQLLAGGRCTWARLSPKADTGARGGGPLKSTPLAILPRKQLADWLNFVEPTSAQPGGAAIRVLAYLAANGASFFEDITTDTGLLRTQVEAALSELASLGLVTADSFAAMRALLLPSGKRRPLHAGRRGRGAAPTALEDIGRWDLVRRRQPDPAALAESLPERVEAIAMVLAKRYGVVFRRLVERESLLPHWRDLLRALRRLEARGELRGGRFVAGFSGEQFALPACVESLRAARERQGARQFVAVHAADPANLSGSVLPGLRIPATLSNRLVLLDGEVVAVQLGDALKFLQPLCVEDQIRARTALTGMRQARPQRGRFRLR